MKFLKALIHTVVLNALVCCCYAQTWEQVNIPANFIKDVITTKEGIVIGELDSRLWLQPNNSVYISNNLGMSWKTYGLRERGVTDLAEFDGRLYATTFYVVAEKDGMFKKDGDIWEHRGPVFSANHIARDSKTLYLTGISHGLWISKDDGIAWEQKIGDGWYGPEIKALFSNENFTMAADQSKVYISTDKGDTWQEVQFLNNKGIDTISGDDRNIIAAGSTGKGMFLSSDLGLTWNTVPSLEQTRVTAILSEIDKTMIIGNAFNEKGYCLLTSTDLKEWHTTTLCQEGGIKTLAKAVADKIYMFALSMDGRLFKAVLPETIGKGAFETPWEDIPSASNITSYFDHEYPLKFYKQFPEPGQMRTTTLNFLGEKEPEPVLYYSGHNGIDFGLEYGTEVKAPASGQAVYYQCYDCGHTIHIFHGNDLESWYMHLQKDGLIAQPGAQPVNVVEGQTIGKVGMTGNTTGPHLHFGISQSNKVFPDAYFDPFGWMSENKSDPWKTFSWTDPNGMHTGTESKYLWKEQIPQVSKFFGPGESNSMNLQNVTLSQETPEDQQPTTIQITSAGKPKNGNLSYIPGTSIYIQAWDLHAGKVAVPLIPMVLEMLLEPQVLGNTLLDTTALYALNEATGLWEKQSSIIDITTKKLVSALTHLSHFAVFAEDPNKTIPVTRIIIGAEQDTAGWYVLPVRVELSTDEILSTTYYSLTGESGWERYSSPFMVDTPGLNVLWFRSMDNNGNIEEIHRILIKIKGNAWIRSTEVKQTGLAVSENYSAP